MTVAADTWIAERGRVRCTQCGKVAYPTLAKAEAACALVNEHHPTRLYLGPCGHYHLARKKGRGWKRED